MFSDFERNSLRLFENKWFNPAAGTNAHLGQSSQIGAALQDRIQVLLYCQVAELCGSFLVVGHVGIPHATMDSEQSSFYDRGFRPTWGNILKRHQENTIPENHGRVIFPSGGRAQLITTASLIFRIRIDSIFSRTGYLYRWSWSRVTPFKSYGCVVAHLLNFISGDNPCPIGSYGSISGFCSSVSGHNGLICYDLCAIRLGFHPIREIPHAASLRRSSNGLRLCNNNEIVGVSAACTNLPPRQAAQYREDQGEPSDPKRGQGSNARRPVGGAFLLALGSWLALSVGAVALPWSRPLRLRLFVFRRPLFSGLSPRPSPYRKCITKTS
jgi:hypothetical protein